MALYTSSLFQPTHSGSFIVGNTASVCVPHLFRAGPDTAGGSGTSVHVPAGANPPQRARSDAWTWSVRAYMSVEEPWKARERTRSNLCGKS